MAGIGVDILDIQNKLNNALQKVKKILGNQFFLSGGQILGAVREKKFLENEHDIDLGIFAEDAKEIIKILKEKDLLDKNSIRKIKYTDTIRAIKFEIDGIGVDVFVYHLFNGSYYAITHDNDLGFAFHKFPKEIFDLQQEIEFLGEKYWIPEPFVYLNCEYGNWRIKKKKWSCCKNPPCLDKKVYLGGIFDLFHIGHLNLLKRARKLGGILIVSVLRDWAAEKYKRKPIIPYDQRVEIVKEFADIVMPQFDVDEVKDGLMDMINPDVIVHGDDKLPHSYNWAIMNRKKTKIYPYTKEQSTSAIINKIKEDY